jgi:hypothetical protein
MRAFVQRSRFTLLGAVDSRRMLRRVGSVVVVLAACTALLVPTANAAKPTRNPFVASPPITFPAGVVCPFEVFLETVENKQTETVFSDGTTKITGFLTSRVVNTENDEELTLVSGGSVRLSSEGDNLLVEIRGPIIVFFFPGDAGPGDVSVGRTFYLHGHTSLVVDPATFAFVSSEQRGEATDLCAALA